MFSKENINGNNDNSYQPLIKKVTKNDTKCFCLNCGKQYKILVSVCQKCIKGEIKTF